MIVMKFGGTSVENAEAMRNVTSIVRQHVARQPLVVVSACSGVTNALLGLAKMAQAGQKTESLEQVEALRVRHQSIARNLFSSDLLATVLSQIDAVHDELRDVAKSIAILGELTPRSRDAFASFGERLSTFLLWNVMRVNGLDAVLLNAQELLITDDDYTRAMPQIEETRKRLGSFVGPKLKQGHIILTQGFIGATAGGIPTTIGRGGSDYSAAIFGALLDAEEIQIWTDVDGMMTSDPSRIKDARLIAEMTFREAAELAYFGAKVLHPATILPAVDKNIPVRVLNSRNPQGMGTVIVREPIHPDPRPAKAIAYKAGIFLVNINSTRMLMTHGFLARVFDVFGRFEKSVDVIATSEVSVSLTVDSEENLEQITKELEHIAEIDVTRGMAVFCVVGENLRRTPGIISRIFGVLESEGISVRMISLGASEINVTFVVSESDVKRAGEALHDALIGKLI